VTSLAVGDRISYGNGPIGAYAQAVNVPANRISRIPDGISDETAGGMMLKGMTVRYLLRKTYEVKAGDTILLHAAAGGIGLIAIQWAKALGATVIGTVGSEDKAELAKTHGCDHVILYKTEDVAKKVREITGGKGVPVVYDGVGQAVVDASLDSLQPFGLWVNFGNASGPVTNFNLGLLSAKGSLYVTRPTLMTYVAKDEDLRETADELFDMVGSGKVKIEINQRYGLSEVRKAHEDLEARRTTGTTIFLPDE
jgi:NADPH2:quinone reductase